jgi:uncharacterized membrane protein
MLPVFSVLDILSVPFSLPPVPPFEGMHVLVVHFPIALLLVAPVFVFLAMVSPVRARWCSFAALGLLILGTAGAFAAVSTGEAARDVVEEGKDEMFAVLKQHEQLAEMVRIVFVIVTVLYALFTLLPSVVRTWITPSYLVPVQMVFLLVLLASSLLVANTAHLGGRLVHEFGVRAVLTASPEAEE